MIKLKTSIALALSAALNASCMSGNHPAPQAAASNIIATDEKNQITEYKLDNGMVVVVKQDRRAAVVISQLWYKVGSSDEYSGITGISHALEHMMFKGTERYSAEDFTMMLRRVGARNNAFTGSDYTGYYQQMEKSHWPLSMELESDRMVNLKLREEDFRKEIEVIKEERRLRTDDRPVSKAYEQLYATAFNNSPYGHPIIGWMEDLQHLTVADLQDWYERWYMPNNAVLVVAGDVQPNDVYELVNRSMGAIPARNVRTSKPRQEAEQTGERRVVMRSELAKQPHLLMAYKVPNMSARHARDGAPTEHEEWEPYALDVLSKILSHGANSRFYKNIVRGQQLAAAASTSYSPYRRYNDLFIVSGSPNLNHSLSQLEEALEKEIELIKTELVDEESLNITKLRKIANEVFSQDSIMHQAYKIGHLEAIGVGWQEMSAYLEGIQKVSAEQVRTVARRYLKPENRTVVHLQTG